MSHDLVVPQIMSSEPQGRQGRTYAFTRNLFFWKTCATWLACVYWKPDPAQGFYDAKMLTHRFLGIHSDS